MCEGLGGGRAEPHRVVGPDEGHVEPEGDPVHCPRLGNFWEFEFFGKSENLVLSVSTLDNEKEGVFRCSIDMMPCTLTVEHRNMTRFWASLWLPEMALCAFCA